MAEFEILNCHANRAGEATVTLRHASCGAIVQLQQVPFEHDYTETVSQECERIRLAAAELAGEAAEYLASMAGWMRKAGAEQHPGAAPQPAQPSDPFGQGSGHH